MNKYARDIEAIHSADAAIDSHLPRRISVGIDGTGIDGALVGFATFIPHLIADLWDAVKAGDLKRAMAIRHHHAAKTRSTAASLPGSTRG
jgi:4-hydroxy-tetrahydrodipicolinate synthase